MTRRVSAGELEARYKTKHELLDFFDEMKAKIYQHFEDKGTSWKTCTYAYLLKQLRIHVKKRDWIDVANFAFFLNNKEEGESNR